MFFLLELLIIYLFPQIDYLMSLKIKQINFYKAKNPPSLNSLPSNKQNIRLIKPKHSSNNSILNEVHLECKRAIANISQKLSELRNSNEISVSNNYFSYTSRIPVHSKRSRNCFSNNNVSHAQLPLTQRSPLQHHLNTTKSLLHNSENTVTESPFIGDTSFGFLTTTETFNSSKQNPVKTHHKIKSTDSKIECRYKRNKIIEITFDKSWYKSNGLVYYPIFKSLLQNPSYQHKTITDQITILYDDIHILKKNFFGDNQIKQIIKHLPFQSILRLNILIEESVVLIHQITKTMLTTYYDEIDSLINIDPPNILYLSTRIVKDEIEEFNFNVMLLHKASLFLKGCLLIFDFIIHKNELYLLKKKDFIHVKYFLDRARMNVTETFFAINNYYKNYIDDITILQKYKEGMNLTNSNSNINIKRDDNKKHENELKVGIKKKYYTDINDRVKRLDLLFFENNNFYLKHSVKKKGDNKESDNKTENGKKIKMFSFEPGYSIVRLLYYFYM